MTTDELLQRWSDGSITADELRELTAKLAEPEHQSSLLDDWLLESSLPDRLLGASVAGLHESTMNRRVERAASTGEKHSAGWISWRPLTAAAAGIVFGMFCTSVVYGFVVERGLERKVPVAIHEPGFEDSEMPWEKDFPTVSARWGGDEARVVAAESGVQPKEGKFMLRLEPAARGVPRAYQVLDLQSLPPDEGGESREIEISASFAAADPEASVRYVIRAFAVTEAPESLDAAWFDQRDSIASASRGLDVTPGSTGWHTIDLTIQVPPAAHTLVLFFGVRTPDKTSSKAAHYLDEVQVSLIDSQPLP